MNEKEILNEIKLSPRYKKNILYGKPRKGHSEGTIEAHIQQLEKNLFEIMALGFPIGIDSNLYYDKLMLLIHVHDLFKAEAKKDSAIIDPESHASLASKFLANYTDDIDLLAMLQYHDLGFAVYRKLQNTGRVDDMRLMSGLQYIKDKNLYLLFCIIDACTPSKGREMIHWYVKLVGEMYPNIVITEKYILPGAMRIGEVW